MPGFFKGGSHIARCSCEHKYQDEKYGKGMRLHTLSADGRTASCTVCENKKNVSA